MAETQGQNAKKDENFIMLPKVDFCFKELMGDSEIRKGFISTVLEKSPEEIEETELLPTIMTKHYPDDKWGVLDVRVKLRDETQIDIEIQLVNYEDWPERSLFYLCKMFAEQIKEGDEYTKLKKCIHVGILNFDLFEGENYYSRFHLWNDFGNDLYSDKLEIHIIELKKVNNPKHTESELLQWARFFGGDRKEDLEKMAEKNPYIEKAYEQILDISSDEMKRREYEFHMKAIRDKNSMLAFKKKYQKKYEEAEKQYEDAVKQYEEAKKQYEDAVKRQAEAEKQQAEAEKQQAEAEKQQAEAEKQQAEANQKVFEIHKMHVLKRIDQVCKKLRKGKSVEVIADELEAEIEEVLPICEIAVKHAPNYDLERIYEEMTKTANQILI